MLNLIITPWFRILAAEPDGAAQPGRSLAAAAGSRRERALELPRVFFNSDSQGTEKPVLAAVPRAC